jgi:hypothetical protein
MIVRVAAERFHIRFVENDTKQVIGYSPRTTQRELGNVDFSAAPFNDE